MIFRKCAPLLMALAVTFVSPALAAPEGEGGGNGWIERLCSPNGDDARQAEWMNHRAERMADKLKLTDAQKSAFKDLLDTRATLRAEHKTAICANKPDLSSFEARLAFRQTLLETRLADMKATSPKLLAFYNSLDDQQKTTFVEMRMDAARGRHRH